MLLLLLVVPAEAFFSSGLPPQGTKINSKGQEVPETVRLYSIASSRYGDKHDGQTCTLCVVRVVWHGEHPGRLGKQAAGAAMAVLLPREGQLPARTKNALLDPDPTTLLAPDPTTLCVQMRRARCTAACAQTTCVT